MEAERPVRGPHQQAGPTNKHTAPLCAYLSRPPANPIAATPSQKRFYRPTGEAVFLSIPTGIAYYLSQSIDWRLHLTSLAR